MRITPFVACVLLAVSLLAGGVAAQQAEPTASAAPASVGLASGDVDETCARIAADLAAVASGETLRVLPILSHGSLRNIGDLQTLRGSTLALVHTDVLNHARRHNLYPGFAESIRYIAKLYDSEVHVLARAEAGTIEELDGKKVAIGPAGSGAAVTAAAVFKALSLNPKLVEMDPALGLEALRTGEVAAMLAVTGKPAALFRTLRADAGVHLLSLPPVPALLDLYAPARILHEDYPDLVADGRPVTTIGVGVALVVFGWPAGTERYGALARFVDAFFLGWQNELASFLFQFCEIGIWITTEAGA